MFSTFLNNQEKNSYIFIGGYESNKIESDLIWLDLKGDYFWYTEFKAIAIEGEDFIFPDYLFYPILDTGTTLMMLPSDYTYKIFEAWTNFGC